MTKHKIKQNNFLLENILKSIRKGCAYSDFDKFFSAEDIVRHRMLLEKLRYIQAVREVNGVTQYQITEDGHKALRQRFGGLDPFKMRKNPLLCGDILLSIKRTGGTSALPTSLYTSAQIDFQIQALKKRGYIRALVVDGSEERYEVTEDGELARIKISFGSSPF